MNYYPAMSYKNWRAVYDAKWICFGSAATVRMICCYAPGALNYVKREPYVGIVFG